MIKISRGMDIPLEGAPEQRIYDAPAARAVAVVGPDYVGMKPTMAVQVGDRVKTGQLLFECKKTNGLRFTSPAGGTVSAINRGARRVLQSVVIDVDGDEAEAFASFTAEQARDLSAEAVRAQLLESGQWTALRQRPFSRVPAPGDTPAAILWRPWTRTPWRRILHC